MTLSLSRIYECNADDRMVKEYREVGGMAIGIVSLRVEETSYWHQNILNKQSPKTWKGWCSSLEIEWGQQP
jgi:hypothetical protein